MCHFLETLLTLLFLTEIFLNLSGLTRNHKTRPTPAHGVLHGANAVLQRWLLGREKALLIPRHG